MSIRDHFKSGREKSALTSFHQVIIRAVFHGSAIAFVIWGPWAWPWRVIVAIIAMLSYGAVASSTRLGKHL